MKLKFIKAEDTEHNAKATVHTSGKLGFSSDAIDFLKLRRVRRFNLLRTRRMKTI